MKQAIVVAVFAVAIWMGDESSGAPPEFEKVSDHCYYLRFEGGGENVAAVLTDQGILVVDPPSEPDLSVAVEALRSLSSKAVRWIVFSNPLSARSAGASYFARQGAVMLAGAQLRDLANPPAGPDLKEASVPNRDAADPASLPWMIFERGIHLFPSDLEIRITAIRNKARTGGDVIVYIPAEKVLFTGGLYEAARYPDIEDAVQGNAAEWIDGLKQVVDSVPVLKPAIPQMKVDPEQEPEKTLEEGIAVISARGEVSNLQNMKDLLSACQKLRADISRALKAGRTRERFLAMPRTDPYRSYGNFDAYAARLWEALAE